MSSTLSGSIDRMLSWKSNVNSNLKAPAAALCIRAKCVVALLAWYWCRHCCWDIISHGIECDLTQGPLRLVNLGVSSEIRVRFCFGARERLGMRQSDQVNYVGRTYCHESAVGAFNFVFDHNSWPPRSVYYLNGTGVALKNSILVSIKDLIV